MSPLLDNDHDLSGERDRELTLSTGSILGIFLGLVLLCGLFFGFGYNLGRRSTAAAPVPANAPETARSSTPTAAGQDAPKPSPGSPLSASRRSSPALGDSSAPSIPRAAGTPADPAPASPSRTAAVSRNSAPPPEHATAAASTPPAPAVAPAGAFIVQIAAVSHKEDAELLTNALRSKGYDVAARTTPQDKFVHIQVGPFATHKDAETMRQRLLADGYNAIVK